MNSRPAKVRTALPVLLAAILSTDAIAITAACIVCINPLRPHYPMNATPFNITACINAANAACSACTPAEIIALCGRPQINRDPLWYEILF